MWSTATKFIVADAANMTDSGTLDVSTTIDNWMTDASTTTGECERSEKFDSTGTNCFAGLSDEATSMSLNL